MGRKLKHVSLANICGMTIALIGLNAAAATPTSPAFMNFPLAEVISGAKAAPAFVWTVRQGDTTSVLFGAAPDFKPRTLFAKTDVDGQPISDALLSPDGRTVVFQTGVPFGGEHTYNPASLIDRPKIRLWTMGVDGGSPREIGPGAGAHFLSDGRLLYRHDADLHVVAFEPAGLKDVVLVKGGASYQGAESLPDGSIVFSQDRGGYAFIGRYAPGAASVEWLATGPDRLEAPVISPDGARVAFLSLPGRQHSITYDQTASEPIAVEVLDLKTKAVRVLWRSKGPAGGSTIQDRDGALRWADDHSLIFHSEQDGWDRLYALSLAGGPPRALTPPNCEAAESALAPSETLAVLHNCRDIDTRQLSLLDVKNGRETPIPLADIVAASPTLAGARYVAFAGGDADTPPLLRVLDLQTRTIVYQEKGSDFGWRAPFMTSAPKAVTFKSADGLTVHGQLFLPRGAGPHPALIYVHGGPSRQMFPAFHFSGYYANDYASNRELADRGYVVLSVNYRSGVGYGRAFREAPDRGWRGASEYRDVQAGAAYLKTLPVVNANRLGIWGGSYGGLLTGQALAHDSDTFKTGVAIHGVFDWSWPSARTAHLNPSHFFGVDPADKAAAFKASPVGAISGWRSPVLLFAGDEDANVDVLETVDMAQRLEAQGVDVRTTIVPGEAHDFVRHSTWVELWREMSAFLDEKLKAGP